jgi:hypothetical protein
MVATVAQASALKPKRLEAAPSKLNIKSAESPTTTAGAEAVAVLGYCL